MSARCTPVPATMAVMGKPKKTKARLKRVKSRSAIVDRDGSSLREDLWQMLTIDLPQSVKTTFEVLREVRAEKQRAKTAAEKRKARKARDRSLS